LNRTSILLLLLVLALAVALAGGFGLPDGP
jgi:hypothetical protein